MILESSNEVKPEKKALSKPFISSFWLKNQLKSWFLVLTSGPINDVLRVAEYRFFTSPLLLVKP